MKTKRGTARALRREACRKGNTAGLNPTTWKAFNKPVEVKP